MMSANALSPLAYGLPSRPVALLSARSLAASCWSVDVISGGPAQSWRRLASIDEHDMPDQTYEWSSDGQVRDSTAAGDEGPAWAASG